MSAPAEDEKASKPTRAEKEATEAKEAAAVPIKPPPEPRVKGVHVILPYLLMGSADVAINKDELKYLGVKEIINVCSNEVDNMFPEDFVYHSFETEDDHTGEPSEHFEATSDIITRIKEERSLVFVHCTEGKNIAPCIVLNYMLQSAKKQNKHLTLLAAYNFLGSKAPGINVSDQFMAQLLEVEEELFEETSIKLKGGGRGNIGGGHHGSRVGVGRGGRGGRGGKGKRGK